MRKNFVICFFISILCYMGISVDVQAMSRNEYEKNVKSIINEYKNINFLNGLGLNINEEVNIEKYEKEFIDDEIENRELYKNGVCTIDKNILKGVNKGTNFLILKGKKNNYVVEIAVNELKATSYAQVNRNYYKVYIDAGHGGADPGALGNGLRETDLNLKIAKKIKNKLEKKNIDIKMTREKEETISLYERAEMANKYGADVFVSIHQNSFTANSAYGIETYYHRDKNIYKNYAEGIQNSIIKNTSGFNRGTKTANFVVLRETNMPSALVECGFITNVNEAKKLNTDAYQEKIASAVADSIYNYLKANIVLTEEKGVFKDTKGHWGESVIKRFVQLGYVNGYSDGTFKPNADITRAEFIKIINNVFNFTKESSIEFQDVRKEAWYYKEVKKAIGAGYISIENRKFRPEENITREEAAAIITNIKKNKDNNLDKIKKYIDYNKVAEWARSSVEGAIEAGYMGKNSDKFRPKDKLSRAEAIALLNPLVK